MLRTMTIGLLAAGALALSGTAMAETAKPLSGEALLEAGRTGGFSICDYVDYRDLPPVLQDRCFGRP